MIKKLGDMVLVQLSDMDSNIYLIGDTAIDAGTGFNFTRLQDFLRIMGKTLDDFKTIINTHCHFDHIGGNGYFFEAGIAIHGDDADIVESGDKEASLAEFFEGNLKARPVERKLSDGDKITAGGIEFEVIHTPGHSPGSICLYDKKSKTLISGDTVFANGIGRTDVPGSDPVAMQESLNKLAKLDIKRILPGHGKIVETGGSKLIASFAKAGVKEIDEDDESMIGAPV